MEHGPRGREQLLGGEVITVTLEVALDAPSAGPEQLEDCPLSCGIYRPGRNNDRVCCGQPVGISQLDVG